MEESGEACEAGAESPESGAKDEGYSTMSSDMQADASRQSDHAADRALPDLNEASDETDNQTIVSINPRESRRHARLLAEADFIYFPIGEFPLHTILSRLYPPLIILEDS